MHVEAPKLDDFALGRPVIDWIVANFPEGTGILELGSGAGSAHLARHFCVRSVEHDVRYLSLDPYVRYIHAPIVDGWYDPERLAAGIREFDYALLIVDGPPGTIGRSKILDHLDLFELSHVDVIVDDVQRDAEIELAWKLSTRLGRRCTLHPSDRGRRFALLEC
jgi:hypothetical protein